MTGTSYYNVEKAAAWRSGGSTQTESRVYNERLILSLIRRHGALSKVDLTQLTGLAPQTITSIVNAAAANDLLLRGEPRRGGLGQPAVPWALKPTGAGSFGLAITATGCRLALLDFTGATVELRELPLADPTPEAAIAEVRAGIDSLLAAHPAFPQQRIAGLGIASPFHGADWPRHLGLDPHAARAWASTDLRAELDALYGWPVYLLPEGIVAAAGELAFGAGNGGGDFLSLTLGASVTAGLVIDSHLVTGRNRLAGLIGGFPAGAPGQSLDAVASATAFGALPPGDAGAEAGWAATAAAALVPPVLAAVGLLDLATVIVDGPFPPAVRKALARELRRLLAAPMQSRPEPFSVIEGSFGAQAPVLGAAAVPLLVRYSSDRNLLIKD